MPVIKEVAEAVGHGTMAPQRQPVLHEDAGDAAAARSRRCTTTGQSARHFW